MFKINNYNLTSNEWKLVEITEVDQFFVVPPVIRSAADRLGPPAGDCVRWQQHRHEATGQPQTQTADIN